MYQTHLIQLFKNLSLKEVNELNHFIRTQSYTKDLKKISHRAVSSEIVIRLFRILRKEYPEFKEKRIGKKLIFKKLYPKAKYSERKLILVRHELSKAIEYYFAYLDMISDPINTNIHIINELDKRNIENLYQINMKAMESMFKRGRIIDEEYFYKKYLFTNLKRLKNEKNFYLGKSTRNLNLFKSEMEYSMSYLLIIILQQLIFSKHIQANLNIEIETELHSQIFNYIKMNENLLKANPMLLIYYKFLIIQQENSNSKDFIKLRNLLIKHQKHFKELHLKFLFIELNRLCINNFLKHPELFNDILLAILKDCINKKVYILDGILHEHNYTSVVSLALRLNQIELAKEFITKFKAYIIPEHRENVFLFNYAAYHYKIKDYDKTLEMLSEVKSKDFYYKNEIYSLELRIYYEINELEIALSKINSYKHFLKNSRLIPDDYRTMYQNFLNYYERIVKIKKGISDEPPGLLITKIDQENEIAMRGWLKNRTKILEEQQVH